MKAGRGPKMKTGEGIPQTFQSPGNQTEALLQKKQGPRDGEFKKELETVRNRDSEGGFMNTVKNLATGLSHGWSSQGYDSKPSGSGLIEWAGTSDALTALCVMNHAEVEHGRYPFLLKLCFATPGRDARVVQWRVGMFLRKKLVKVFWKR